MGLNYSGAKLFLELWHRGLLEGMESVIDVGIQKLNVTLKEFEKLIRGYGILKYNQNTFSNLKHWPNQPRCSCKPFYEMLGFKEYACINRDAPEATIPHDLNLPFTDKNLYGRYDLVTELGGNEHAFNIAETYRTMHHLCKPKGLIIITQVAYKGSGYHNFDLSFFEGLAAANRYNVLFSSFIVSTKGNISYHIPLSTALVNILNVAKVNSLGICYVFQKTSDSDFQVPYAGPFLPYYKGCIGFKIQYHLHPPMRTYIPIYADNLNKISGMVLIRVVFNRIIKKLINKAMRF